MGWRIWIERYIYVVWGDFYISVPGRPGKRLWTRKPLGCSFIVRPPRLVEDLRSALSFPELVSSIRLQIRMKGRRARINKPSIEVPRGKPQEYHTRSHRFKLGIQRNFLSSKGVFLSGACVGRRELDRAKQRNFIDYKVAVRAAGIDIQ